MVILGFFQPGFDVGIATHLVQLKPGCKRRMFFFSYQSKWCLYPEMSLHSLHQEKKISLSFERLACNPPTLNSWPHLPPITAAGLRLQRIFQSVLLKLLKYTCDMTEQVAFPEHSAPQVYGDSSSTNTRHHSKSNRGYGKHGHTHPQRSRVLVSLTPHPAARFLSLKHSVIFQFGLLVNKGQVLYRQQSYSAVLKVSQNISFS